MNASDLQPHLVGEWLELRPLAAEDWEALFAVASDPKIWELHPVPERYQEKVFKEFFREALEGRGALVAVDRQDGKIIGSSRYCWHGAAGELEIGWTFLARSHWGGVYNGEMKRLMLAHGFTFAERIIFRVGATNARSRRAVEKIGAVLTDRREQMTLHGKSIEHVIYEVLAHGH
ncbi:MAG TPA: GNAT family N-acetyltransferase [Verrucomicrobiae bacterium]|jgi:RimJ/RimL family protein N-acetyltransferase